jgi:hypothetical protein
LGEDTIQPITVTQHELEVQPDFLPWDFGIENEILVVKFSLLTLMTK